jgi:hypothetical protein
MNPFILWQVLLFRSFFLLGEDLHNRDEHDYGANHEREFFLRVVPLHKIVPVCSCNSRKAVSN